MLLSGEDDRREAQSSENSSLLGHYLRRCVPSLLEEWLAGCHHCYGERCLLSAGKHAGQEGHRREGSYGLRLLCIGFVEQSADYENSDKALITTCTISKKVETPRRSVFSSTALKCLWFR